MKDKGSKAKKQYSTPEPLYDLDRSHSVNTIFGKAAGRTTKGKEYAGTPGVATINLGGKDKTDDVIDVDDDSDDMSALSIIMNENLIALVCKVKLSASPKGSAPKVKGSRSKVSNSEGSHSSSDSSSDSSSCQVKTGLKPRTGPVVDS